MHELDLIQSALPRYEITGELGRGAWGVVLGGTHKALGRPVAIKQLPRAFGADPEVRARFLSEARLLASLDHPHIVQMFDFVERDGLCVIVMELLTGGTVWDRFSDEGLSPQAACAVVAGTCEGLHYAHEKGVLHRDVKPQNLMFSGEGVLKITDFGIAKVVAGSRTLATQAGFVLGTPAYMSPEQAQGKELTPCTDVYAAGTVLYELLSGSLPFPDLSDPVASLYQRVHEEPKPLTEVAPELPTALADVVHRALSRDPGDRYASGAEFCQAITNAAADAWGPGWTQVSGVILRGSGLGPVTPSTGTRAPVPTNPPPAAADATPPAEVSEALTAGGRVKRATTRLQPAAAVAAVDVKPEDLVPAGEVLAPLPTSTRQRGGGGRRVGIIAAAVVAVLAIAGGAVAMMGGGKDSPRTTNEASGTTVATAAGATGTTAAPVRSAPLFTDDFSRAGSGWLTGDDGQAGLKYEAGGYTMTLRAGSVLQIVDTTSMTGRSPDITSQRDVGVEVSVIPVSGTGRMGVGCRGNAAQGDFYLGSITPGGAWSIDKLVKGSLTKLQQGDGPPTNLGTKTAIRLDCYDGEGGTTLALSMNGQPLGNAVDRAGLPAGALALLGSTGTDPNFTLRFTNFAVYQAARGTRV